jgi:hypothetical protein
MKKFYIAFSVSLSLFLCTITAEAYTVYFEFSDGLQFDDIQGFDLFTSAEIADPLSLSMALYSQGSTSPTGKDGAIPLNYAGIFEAYDIFLANYGVSSLRNFDSGDIPGWDTNFTPGTVLSISSPVTFSFDEIVLLAGTESGLYEGQYAVHTEAIADGMIYTASAVPVPGAVWLLGAGLSGLVALRRRTS